MGKGRIGVEREPKNEEWKGWKGISQGAKVRDLPSSIAAGKNVGHLFQCPRLAWTPKQGRFTADF